MAIKIYTPEGEIYQECDSIHEAEDIIEDLDEGYYYEASDIPPENAPIARSLWSRSWGFFRLRSVPKPRPTSPAIRQGRVGFWPSARTALARGAAPAQIAGPTGCRIGGLGRFRKGRSARLTDVFA